jgi:hypothetical protein
MPPEYTVQVRRVCAAVVCDVLHPLLNVLDPLLHAPRLQTSGLCVRTQLSPVRGEKDQQMRSPAQSHLSQVRPP